MHAQVYNHIHTRDFLKMLLSVLYLGFFVIFVQFPLKSFKLRENLNKHPCTIYVHIYQLIIFPTFLNMFPLPKPLKSVLQTTRTFILCISSMYPLKTRTVSYIPTGTLSYLCKFTFIQYHHLIWIPYLNLPNCLKNKHCFLNFAVYLGDFSVPLKQKLPSFWQLNDSNS